MEEKYKFNGPVIGILTEQLEKTNTSLSKEDHQSIKLNVVNFIEGMGGRVIPIQYSLGES